MRGASITGEGHQRKKVYANGSTYVGGLDAKGRRNGYGAMVFRDGTYEGNWRHGKQSGRGTYVWTSGSQYEGEWSEGQFEGRGTYTWPSGATYTGQWKSGRKHGHGRFLWANGTFYDGQFADDKKMGFGEYTSGSDNTKYVGEYVDDKMHGEGTYLFSDGARYVGRFVNNNFDGAGCYTTPDGTSYIGEFKGDQRHGIGLLKSPHLGTFKVRYVHGKIVEHQDIVAWLYENECAKYTTLFRKEEITFDVVVELSDEDLIRLGIAEFGKRKKLLSAIAQLPTFRQRSQVVPSGILSSAQVRADMRRRSINAENFTSNGQPSDDDDYDELNGIQAEDHYADLGEGLVLLETEEKDNSHYRKSSEYACCELEDGEEAEVQLSAAEGLASYRLIHAKELRIQRHPVGRGVFGVVYSAEWRGAQVAVKKLIGALGEKELAELHREAKLLEKLCHHPHVVNYLGLAKIPELCLVTQFYPKGSLYDIVVKRKEKVGWKCVVSMARDAAAGILHLHCEHVIHRDIATRNCLVDANYRVVVTDFGLSRVKTSAYLMTNNSFGPVSWMAPEALIERKFSEKSDAYSFGIMLWELVARKINVYPDELSPFDIATAVIAGKRPAIPDSCPKELRELMMACWEPEPVRRPDFYEIERKLSAYFYSLDE